MPSTCGWLLRPLQAMRLARPRASRWPHAERLPFDQPCNGLQVLTRRGIYTPSAGIFARSWLSGCRQEIGEALFDSLEEWMPGLTETFVCPECGFEDDINGFLFLQPCAFSNLALVFNSWPAVCFSGGSWRRWANSSAICAWCRCLRIAAAKLSLAILGA